MESAIDTGPWPQLDLWPETLFPLQTAMLAQQTGDQQTNLVSNVARIGKTTDQQLANPWGISILPGQDFWIANNKSGTSTLYDNQGNKDSGLVVTIPGASHNPNGNCSPGCPTGTVSNGNGKYFGGTVSVCHRRWSDHRLDWREGRAVATVLRL